VHAPGGESAAPGGGAVVRVALRGRNLAYLDPARLRIVAHPPGPRAAAAPGEGPPPPAGAALPAAGGVAVRGVRVRNSALLCEAPAAALPRGPGPWALALARPPAPPAAIPLRLPERGAAARRALHGHQRELEGLSVAKLLRVARLHEELDRRARLLLRLPGLRLSADAAAPHAAGAVSAPHSLLLAALGPAAAGAPPGGHPCLARAFDAVTRHYLYAARAAQAGDAGGDAGAQGAALRGALASVREVVRQVRGMGLFLRARGLELSGPAVAHPAEPGERPPGLLGGCGDGGCALSLVHACASLLPGDLHAVRRQVDPARRPASPRGPAAG